MPCSKGGMLHCSTDCVHKPPQHHHFEEQLYGCGPQKLGCRTVQHPMVEFRIVLVVPRGKSLTIASEQHRVQVVPRNTQHGHRFGEAQSDLGLQQPLQDEIRCWDKKHLVLGQKCPAKIATRAVFSNHQKKDCLVSCKLFTRRRRVPPLGLWAGLRLHRISNLQRFGLSNLSCNVRVNVYHLHTESLASAATAATGTRGGFSPSLLCFATLQRQI